MYIVIFIQQVCYFFYNPTDSGAVQLTQSNLDTILGKARTHLLVHSKLCSLEFISTK